MPRRLLSFAAVLALALVAGSGCASDVSPAALVGATDISDSDLLDEVDEWAHNPEAFDENQLAELNPGTYPMELADAILQQRIDLELHRQKFEELDLDLTDDLRQQALLGIFQDLSQAQTALDGFSEDYATDYVDDIARRGGVELELGREEYLAWLSDAYVAADIEVSPRYGRWDPDAQSVVGPDGPTQPSLPSDEL